MQKTPHSLDSCTENFPLIQISSILSVNFTSLWHKCQRVFWWASCTSARHAGSFDCLMTSLILITMDDGRGHCAYWQSCKVPNQTHRGIKKMENVCYKTNWDMCRIPGHATQASVGFVRYTWASAYRPQPRFLTNQPWPGLGSMSRYSAQILICITKTLLLFARFSVSHIVKI